MSGTNTCHVCGVKSRGPEGYCHKHRKEESDDKERA